MFNFEQGDQKESSSLRVMNTLFPDFFSIINNVF